MSASPLGRYAPLGRETVVVVLRGLPVLVAAAAREHHDDLLREARLLALAGPPAGEDARLAEVREVLGRRFAAARPRRDGEVDEALRAGLETLDQVARVPVTAGSVLADLERLLVLADELSAEARLLLPPRTPVVRAYTRWYVGEFQRQADGLTPARWDGPLRP